MSKLLAVGTVAFDAIETPFGKTDKILGGSGSYIGLSASQFGVETGVVSVVGGVWILTFYFFRCRRISKGSSLIAVAVGVVWVWLGLKA